MIFRFAIFLGFVSTIIRPDNCGVRCYSALPRVASRYFSSPSSWRHPSSIMPQLLRRAGQDYARPWQRRSVLLQSSNNFYDDFQDFGEPIGSDDNTSNGGNNAMNNNLSVSNLQSRMSQVSTAEASYDAKLARNWRRGNWGVRGFALDKSSFGEPVHVCAIAAPTSSSSSSFGATDISLPQDRALPEDRSVAVGRTDGSIYVVKLGEEYLTTFVSTTEEGNDEAGTSMTRVPTESMNPGEPSTGDEIGGRATRKPSSFEITHHIPSLGEPISRLVFHDVIEKDNGCDGIICSAAGSSGDISMWELPSSSSEMMEATLLSGVHHNQIVSLNTMVLQNDDNMAERNVLFSASRDGTIALWDLDRKGALILSCQCTDVGNDMSLTCADVSNPTSEYDDYNYNSENDNDVIFLGTSDGYVVGYAVNELLSLSRSSSEAILECPVPNLRFRAHGTDSGKGEAVTAIKCGGDGTIPTSARLRGVDESQNSSSSISKSPRLFSTILLTGGEDGSVKQWEILSQKTQSSPSSIRMEHWPRLSSQRMKRRSHLFSPGHDGAVTSISKQDTDSSKFLTCGRDGSVCVWSASTGKELFRMDGFSGDISTMAFLGRELLVTDGMEEYVCVHDFGIEEDAASSGYELEW